MRHSQARKRELQKSCLGRLQWVTWNNLGEEDVVDIAMEIYQENVAVTPHHNKMKGSLKFGLSENVAKTPFQKQFNQSTVNTPAALKLGSAKNGSQPRRALMDISNNGNQALPLAPKTASKTAVKPKQTVSKAVRFDDEIETCTRISNYKYTPRAPEADRAVKIITGRWVNDPELWAEFERECDKEPDVQLDQEQYVFEPDPSAFELETALMLE